ncbi:MAG: alkaline phosphatase family protein, partial [Rhodothermales bacterium]|nr:alkaline phosphatase family protein [Rhodothermales bacterium]
MPLAEPAGASGSVAFSPDYSDAIDTITFGSCARETDPQPIWWSILDADPDVFLFTGDNIYGDTDDMQVMRNKYDSLGAKPGYDALRRTIPVMATWDDHDYGRNDAGSEYEYRQQSQEEFLRFFEVPRSSPRWSREGVYSAKTFGPVGRRTQIIMLDTRYFRSGLERWPKGQRQY